MPPPRAVRWEKPKKCKMVNTLIVRDKILCLSIVDAVLDTPSTYFEPCNAWFWKQIMNKSKYALDLEFMNCQEVDHPGNFSIFFPSNVESLPSLSPFWTQTTLLIPLISLPHTEKKDFPPVLPILSHLTDFSWVFFKVPFTSHSAIIIAIWGSYLRLLVYLSIVHGPSNTKILILDTNFLNNIFVEELPQ